MGLQMDVVRLQNSEITEELHGQLLLRTSSSYVVQMTSEEEKLKAGMSRA